MVNAILVWSGELSVERLNRPEFIKCSIKNIKKSLIKYQNIDYKKERFFIINYSQTLVFKVENKRCNKTYKYSPLEFKKIISEKILNKHKFGSDLINPDSIVIAEILLVLIITTTKGYPVSIKNKILLLSAKIDLPISAYLLMQFGIEVHYSHSYKQSLISDQIWIKILSLIKTLKRYEWGASKIYRYNFISLQNEISHIKLFSYWITITRRLFMCIAGKITKDSDILVSVTNEWLEKVAWYKIESLNVINNVTDLAVLRSLITYDKKEIIKLAKMLKHIKYQFYNIVIFVFYLFLKILLSIQELGGQFYWKNKYLLMNYWKVIFHKLKYSIFGWYNAKIL